MALFGGGKADKDEIERLKRQNEVLSNKLKRFEQNVRTGIFNVGQPSDFEGEAVRLGVQSRDIPAFIDVCKAAVAAAKAGSFTFQDAQNSRFHCEIKPEGAGVNVLRRDVTLLEAALGPGIVEKALSGGHGLAQARAGLKPGVMEITVMACVLPGLGDLAGQKNAEKVGEALLPFCRLGAGLVQDNGGLALRSLSRGFLALFGAIESLEDRETKAVRCGAQILSASKAQGSILPASVVLASGSCLVGDVGYEHRLDFAAIGEAVDTATALAAGIPEGALWAAASVVKGCSAGFTWKPLPPAKIAGRSKPVEVHSLDLGF